MKVLIIGGTGVISTPMTRMLLEQNHQVIHYNRGNAKDLFPAVQTLIGDRTDVAAFRNIINKQTFDCVIDMVCYKPEEASNAIDIFQGQVGQYIFCSTVDVYTKPAPHYPVTEDTPRQPDQEFRYAYDKAQCEDIFFKAYQQHAFPVTIIRPAYTYREGRGILHTLGWSTDYLARIQAGKPIITHGDGNSFWVACHADDVAKAFVSATGKAQTHGQAYHVAGQEWLTWNQYHQIVAEASGCQLPEVVHIPTRVLYKLAPEKSFWAKVNFQFNNLFDNTLARQELDFSYSISWLEGARRVINSLEGNIKEDDNSYDVLISRWRELERKL